MSKSPAKPWELTRSASTPQPLTPSNVAAVPAVPPRTYSSSYDGAGYAGSSPYGGSAYGRGSVGGYGYGRSTGYGGSYGSYGGSYGGGSSGGMYGGRSGYGGYGGRGLYGGTMGRTRGGYGGGYGGAYGGGYGNDGPLAGPNGPGGGGGWMDSVQRTLHGFGQFSQLLDGSYFSMHESFMSMMEFLHVIGELRHHVLFVVKAVAALMLLQVTGRSIKDFVTGKSSDVMSEDLASFRSFAPSGKKASIWPKVALVAGLLVVFGPYLLRRIFGAYKPAKKIPARRVVIVYDYKAETPEELSLRTGDIVTVDDERTSAEWWQGHDERGNKGFFPSSFCETLVDEEEEAEGRAKKGSDEEEEEEEELDEEAKAQRKRCMEIVRERRRRDREAAAAAPSSRTRSGVLSQSAGSRRRPLPAYDEEMEEDDRARRLSYSNPVY